MELSIKKQAIMDRRGHVKEAYENRGGLAVNLLVIKLSKKFRVTTVTIFNDIKSFKTK